MIEILRQNQINESKIPKRYLMNNKLRATTENDFDVFTKLLKYCANIRRFVKEGHNLLLYSSKCGNGKTSWACRLALAYIDNYSSNYAITSPVIFINAAEYISEKKRAISDKQLAEMFSVLDNNLYNADLVIWDDIATKSLSEYDMDLLYIFINNRISNMKSNIFTSNCNLEELPAIMGTRLSSRIINNSICHELTGKDNRRDEFNV